MSQDEVSVVTHSSKTIRTKQYKDECQSLLETIVALQMRVFKTPDLYVKEVLHMIKLYKEQFEAVKQNPGTNNQKFILLSAFLSKVAIYFKTDMAFFVEDLVEIINHFQTTLNPQLRKKIVFCLLRLRGKGLIECFKNTTFLMKLFNCQDKDLRKIIYRYIIKDIKMSNNKSMNHALNKQLQNFIVELIKKSTDNIAKRALQILIELYNKNIWKDTKVINIIAQGCFSQNYKIKLLSCYFLIETTEVRDELESSDDEAEEYMQKKGKSKSVKPTKARQHRLEKQKKKAGKKQRKRLRIQNQNGGFFPLDLIFSPQDFGDRLFALLKKSESERFTVKLAMMHVISRLINRHQLIIIPYYTFIQKYLFPGTKEIAKVFAYLAEAVHETIPREDLDQVVKHIIDQFINDRCQEQAITMGLRTIYQMVQKHSQLLDRFNINYLVSYTKYKNRNVSEAARAIVNHYKTTNPQLLERKYRGRQWKAALELDGEEKVHIPVVGDSIAGANLLQMEENKRNNTNINIPIYCDRVLTDEDFKRIRALQRKQEADQEMERLALKKQQKEEQSDDEDEDEDYDDDEDEGNAVEDEDIDYENASDISAISGENSEWESDGEEDDDEDDTKAKNKKRRQSLSSLEDSVEQYYSDQSQQESDENPHGFVQEGDITKYKKTKSEQKKEKLDQLANGEKEKWKRGKNRKSEFASTTNKEKLKSKPLAMVRPKKVKQQNSQATIKKKIKDLKNKLGHVRSGKEAKTLKKTRLR